MHSIAMQSLQFFLNDFLLYRQSNPVLPFPPFDPAAVAAEVDAVSGCDNFGSSVPFGLVQSEDITAFCGTGSQEGVDVADAVDTFDSCCANIKRAKREFFQPRSCLGGLVLHAGGLPHRPLPSSLLPSECPPRSFSSRFLPRFPPCFFRRVGCSTPTMPRLLHSLFFAYLYVTYKRYYSPRCGSHAFRGGVPTFLSQARLPREAISRCCDPSPPVPAAGTLALSASTSSCISRCHVRHPLLRELLRQ